MESIDSIYTEVCSSNNNKEAYKVLQTWAYENHSGSDVLDVLKALMCPLFWFFSAKMILSLSPGLAHLKFFGSEKEKISNSKEIENSNGAFKLRCKKLCYVTSPNESSTFIFRILFEGLFVIVPLLVALMHSQWTWFCLILSLLFGLFLVLLTAQERNTDLIIGDLNSEFKTFISEFRSLMMIFVVASILAVDFTTFPRRFAKTESYGFSLMDAGVGIFIISNSIVAGRKTHYSWGLSQRLTSAVRSTLPLLILGFTRLVTVKAVNYQEHVTEYGVHWNFFFTIFFVTLFSTLLNFFMRQSFLTLLSTFILFVYQFCLELLNLSFYIINAPRYTNFFSMNREGFCGLCGFFFLYTCGLQLGSFLLKPRTVRDWKFLVLQLAALDLFLWLALLGVIYLGGLAPSRRLVSTIILLSLLNLYL
jgi:phosphatidylinositol glycan class W